MILSHPFELPQYKRVGRLIYESHQRVRGGTNQVIRGYTRNHYLDSPEDAQHLRNHNNPMSTAKMESTLVGDVDAACNPWVQFQERLAVSPLDFMRR